MHTTVFTLLDPNMNEAKIQVFDLNDKKILVKMAFLKIPRGIALRNIIENKTIDFV